jgi:hypothetical protein
MYFDTKSYLKSTHNYTVKHAINIFFGTRIWILDTFFGVKIRLESQNFYMLLSQKTQQE